jgi:HD-like signal output (HDOD) protein
MDSWETPVILKRLSAMLRGLFRSNVPSPEDQRAATAAKLEQKVLDLVDNMPTLPDTATRAMAMANDPNSSFADLARLIEADAAIATGLLRVANSTLYAGGLPAVKLQQALVRLGLRQCQNLIVAVGVQSLFRGMAGATKAQCEVLWGHAYTTAGLCRRLNRAYRLGFDGEEFSAGLLHDLGRILLVLADAECFNRADACDFNEGPDRLDREREAIGIDHCALGGWFGEHSKLPESLIETMRFHHDPEQSDKAKGLVAMVAAADHMANHLQRGEPVEQYRPEDNPGLACLAARWSGARRERLVGEVPQLLAEAAATPKGL